MDEVARHYGFEPNRAGFMRCPFHQGDHTASLKIYAGDRGWHCFGCNSGGSVIDFVMRLYEANQRRPQPVGKKQHTVRSTKRKKK